MLLLLLLLLLLDQYYWKLDYDSYIHTIQREQCKPTISVNDSMTSSSSLPDDASDARHATLRDPVNQEATDNDL